MDTESFKREFLPYHRKLYCVAYRLLENAADAEDLVQEAYLKLWDKREGLSVISNPEAFSVTLVFASFRKVCSVPTKRGAISRPRCFSTGQSGST